MNIKFCGADESVTGSRHLFTINDKRLLLDCGLVQGGDDARADQPDTNKTFLFDPLSIDAVIISHAHIDHVGALPRLFLNLVPVLTISARAVALALILVGLLQIGINTGLLSRQWIERFGFSTLLILFGGVLLYLTLRRSPRA